MHPHATRLLGLIALLVTPTRAHAQPAGAADPAQPTPVTLKFDNAPQKAVVEELAKQANVTLTPDKPWERMGGGAITVDLKDKPFWAALREVCGKASLSLVYSHDDPKLIILKRDNQDWTKFPHVDSGPFVVNLLSIERRSFVNMNKPKDLTRAYTVRYVVYCEPRFRLLQGSLSAKVEEATDDAGNSLVPKTAAAADAKMNFATSWAFPIDAQLDYPKEGATKIAELRASAKFVVQTKSEVIELADPLTSKDVTKVVGGRKVTIREVRRGPEEYEARVTFGRGEVPANQWEQTVFPGNALRLIDAAGKANVAHGFGMGGKADESTYIFKFEKEPPGGSRIGKPVKLTWEVPTQTREVPVTFEFSDLPLP
jgi:hypothetical protein